MREASVTKTRPDCGFFRVATHYVSGDFDGFEPQDRILNPGNCPVCKAMKLLKKKIKKFKKKLRVYFDFEHLTRSNTPDAETAEQEQRKELQRLEAEEAIENRPQGRGYNFGSDEAEED